MSTFKAQQEQDLARYCDQVAESRKIIDSFLQTFNGMSHMMRRHLCINRFHVKNANNKAMVTESERRLIPVYIKQIERYIEAADDYDVFSKAANKIRIQLGRNPVFYPEFPKAYSVLVNYNPSRFILGDIKLDEFNHI